MSPLTSAIARNEAVNKPSSTLHCPSFSAPRRLFVDKNSLDNHTLLLLLLIHTDQYTNQTHPATIPAPSDSHPRIFDPVRSIPHLEERIHQLPDHSLD